MDMNDENFLEVRLDTVRRYLENQDVRLSQWAIDYWTTVREQLERKWKLASMTNHYPTTAEIISQHKQFLRNINAPREKSYDD